MGVNPTTVRFALRDQFKRDTAFRGVTIEADEAINANPKRKAWIGVMGEEMTLTPHAQAWRLDTDLVIYVQATSPKSGEAAATAVGAMVEKVIANLEAADKQIRTEGGAALSFIRQASVVPGYPLDQSGTTKWFRSEIITLTLEART